ncbi:PREDICTED: uncharacterized protein LOC109217573 [Nicotiana attenuata]|uniref:Neprosin PEP catalytic domain-containing protein n=1 Tax=Nicotiana attenuata TaxID=49451 RepID=A0A1J6KBW9_NICAT|nr:PREDICTED: uncharacterized protein LOC109217573 [Nicotiana attenuata]OIT22456.1 hypothetical protein A4A49_40284 [Nicotiana attenuata]
MLLHVKARIQFLLSIFLLLRYDKADAGHSLSEKECLKLEKQLKLLNKPAIKTIKTNNGDVYDCVDFYKQPAFDHPLLKNHDFSPQMKPSLHKLERHVMSSKTIGLEGGGCPFGTVPIRRVTKDYLIRQRHMQGMDETPAFHGNNLNDSEAVAFKGGYRYAGVQLPDDETNDITGAGTIMSLHKPLVQKNQHSAGRVKVQNGPDSIQAGWIVDPTLYGDNNNRLYVFFKAGKSGCFNTLCPGFVQVDTKVPLGIQYPASKIGGPVYEELMYLDRDHVNGNWWLLHGINYTEIGFWPASIFTGLKNQARTAEWGGVAYSPPGQPEPQMGSGLFPAQNYLQDAYFRKCTFIYNSSTESLDASLRNTIANSPDLYQVQDLSHQGDVFGHLILYGGPGEGAGPIL